MALGLHVGARLLQFSDKRREAWEREELISDLAAAVTEFLTAEGLQHLAETRIVDGHLRVHLHPAAEPVRFAFTEDHLTCRAVTSAAGPGYHAAVARMLDHAGAVLGIDWVASDQVRGYGDDTGYFSERSYPDLQVAMARHLTRLANVLMSQESRENIQLSVPLGFPQPVADFFAMSPMGFWDREVFEDITAGTVHSLASICEAFFPWWHKDQDAVFWRNAGLCLTWTDVPWHPPANDHERAIYARALKCFQIAHELDGAVQLPKSEMAEMAMFAQMNAQEPAPIPHHDGVGFWRRKLRRRLAGSWSAVLPGYFYAAEQETGHAALFWHNGLKVEVRTHGSVDGSDQRAQPAQDQGGADGKDQQEGELTFVSALEKGQLMGRAYLMKRRDEDGEHWSLEGRITSPDGLCAMSLSFPPEDGYLDWAREVFESIECAA